nr:hypothetical protein [Tanacetum cinerariifolium]
MACIEEIAKDQLLVLIKRQVKTKLMLEEKFGDLCEEVSNFVKESKDVVNKVGRLSCKDVAKETVRLLRCGQNCDTMSSPDPSDNLSKYLLASPAISPFHNVKAYNITNKPPIPPQDLITPPTILTPSPVLPASPLFDPQHFFVLKELLPPKKQVDPPSSSSTTLSNLSRKQACILVPPSFSTYTPTPPQKYELGKSSIKMRVKHHEKQIESILSYLEELSFHYIENIEERLVNGWIIYQEILMK